MMDKVLIMNPQKHFLMLSQQGAKLPSNFDLSDLRENNDSNEAESSKDGSK